MAANSGTMTRGDIDLCINHASRIDPSRGTEWVEAFDKMADRLGDSSTPRHSGRPFTA
jgi:hypothetical protein